MAEHWTTEAERIATEDIDLLGEADDGHLYCWEPCLLDDEGHWRRFTWWRLRHVRAWRKSRRANVLVMLEVKP